MSRSDHASGQMSTYRFPEELRVDELLLRGPIESDIETIAPAFRDPAVGGEASLPPVDADTLRVMLREQLPGMRAQGLSRRVRHRGPAARTSCSAARRCTTSIRCVTSSRSATGSSSRPEVEASRPGRCSG